MSADSTIEMFVTGLVLDPSTQAPVIILKDATGKLSLPIWIGIAEATSIASAIKQLNLSRPLTHDLLYEILVKANFVLEKVVITDLRDSTYFSDLIITRAEDNTSMVIDARPSDAIALAVRAQAPILVAESVIEQAKAFSQMQLSDSDRENSSDEGGGEHKSSSRDFQAIDKEKWKEILEDLDPDDFKYKM